MPEHDDEDNPSSLADQDRVPPMESLGICNRVQVPRQMIIPTMKRKHHEKEVYEGVGFPQIKSITVKCEMDRIKNHFAGAGYSNKRGVINLQFDNNAPASPNIMEDHTDAQILGFILVQKYGIKKGIELLSKKADVAVVKELTQTHKLETYEPIMASYMSWEKKKKALESLLFITEKRNRDINSQKLSDGSKQRKYDS